MLDDDKSFLKLAAGMFFVWLVTYIAIIAAVVLGILYVIHHV